MEKSLNLPDQNIETTSKNSALANIPPIRKFEIKHILTVALSILLIFSLTFTYFFWWVPEAEAKEYLEETSKDFEAVQIKLQKYEASFNPIAESFKVSSEAFYEIAKSRNYFEALTDTQQDISDIKTTLELIDEAINTKAELVVPDKFLYLDEQLNNYYQEVKASMKLLLEYEEFQLHLLDASGTKLNEELLKLESIYKSGAERATLIEYFDKVAVLAAGSVLELGNEEDVSELYIELYDNVLTYHFDLAGTTGRMVNFFKLNTEAGDQAAEALLIKFLENTQARNEKIKKWSETFVEKFPVASLFQEVSELEIEIKNEFGKLKEEYGLSVDQEDNEDEKVYESTISGILDATPSATETSSSAETTQSAR